MNTRLNETKDCPQCGRVNTGSALGCDCGYDFASGRRPSSRSCGERRSEKDTRKGFHAMVGLFMVILFGGYYGYMISPMFPNAATYRASFWIAVPSAIYFLVRFYRHHPGIKQGKTMASVGFAFAICPLTLFLLWSTFAYSLPDFLSVFSSQPYAAEHVIKSKHVSCAKLTCRYFVRLNRLNPRSKSGTKVKKAVYDQLNEGDKVWVEGYQSPFGIAPTRLRIMEIEP